MKYSKFDTLSFYTMAHPDPGFIHQHVVDAYGAQTADRNTKPIRVVYALVGLYLMLEKGFTGKQVQSAHLALSRYKAQLPEITIPDFKGSITIEDVLKAQEGISRDKMIQKWCESVWEAYKEAHPSIKSYVGSRLD